MFNFNYHKTNQKVFFCRGAPLTNKLARKYDRSILKSFPQEQHNRNVKLVIRKFKQKEKSKCTRRLFIRKPRSGGGWGSVQFRSDQLQIPVVSSDKIYLVKTL